MARPLSALSFSFHGTIVDVDQTVPGQARHPSVVVLVEFEDATHRVIVPAQTLRQRLPLLIVGRPIRLHGIIEGWPGRCDHVATFLELPTQ